MRLKTLFFPIMLVISLSIFFGYIMPEIKKLRTANGVAVSMDQELRGVNLKKEAINTIGQKISSGDVEKIVKEYLPEAKVEERIINNINYLASDASVSLSDISLNSKDAVFATGTENKDKSAPALNVDANSKNLMANPEMMNSVEESVMHATSVNISVIGEYDKIKIFINELQRMPILNTIRSLTISKKVAEKKISEEAEVSNTNDLTASMVVDFGYMGITKVDSQKVLTFNTNMGEIDNETVNTLKTYVSKKDQAVLIEGETSGKINPFFVD